MSTGADELLGISELVPSVQSELKYIGFEAGTENFDKLDSSVSTIDQNTNNNSYVEGDTKVSLARNFHVLKESESSFQRSGEEYTQSEVVVGVATILGSIGSIVHTSSTDVLQSANPDEVIGITFHGESHERNAKKINRHLRPKNKKGFIAMTKERALELEDRCFIAFSRRLLIRNTESIYAFSVILFVFSSLFLYRVQKRNMAVLLIQVIKQYYNNIVPIPNLHNPFTKKTFWRKQQCQALLTLLRHQKALGNALDIIYRTGNNRAMTFGYIIHLELFPLVFLITLSLQPLIFSFYVTRNVFFWTSQKVSYHYIRRKNKARFRSACLLQLWWRYIFTVRMHAKWERYTQGGKWTIGQSNLVLGVLLGWRVRRILR